MRLTEIVWGITSAIDCLSVSGGITFILAGSAATPGEVRFARYCFIVPAGLLSATELGWLMITDAPWWWRVLTGLAVGAAVFVGLPEGLRWIHHRQEIAPPKLSHVNPPLAGVSMTAPVQPTPAPASPPVAVSAPVQPLSHHGPESSNPRGGQGGKVVLSDGATVTGGGGGDAGANGPFGGGGQGGEGGSAWLVRRGETASAGGGKGGVAGKPAPFRPSDHLPEPLATQQRTFERLTDKYVSEHPDQANEYTNYGRLPPPDWLNAELEKASIPLRVRQSAPGTVEIYRTDGNGHPGEGSANP
jgi:hypothetical protein